MSTVELDPHPPRATEAQLRDHVRAAETDSEALRLDVLHDYGILDTPREGAFDDLTRIAAAICGTPMAMISLVDRDRQWFKSTVGVDMQETPIQSAICAHAILQDEVLVVPDTQEDTRFVGNPLVAGHMHLRFYAGAPLRTADGTPLGTVCVLDRQPRKLEAQQVEALQALARQAMTQIELRRTLRAARADGSYRAQLMAVAGHDLRTPLRSAGYALEKAKRSSDEAGSRLLKVAQDALLEIGHSFDELAAMARAERGAPDMLDLPVGELIDSVLAAWRRRAQAKGLALRCVPSSLRVRSNRPLLATVIGNLVGNAVKYTEQGSVLVGCRPRGERVLVEVIDTGPGMDVSGDGALFDTFRQADPASEGLGLGLWIVQQTVPTLAATLKAHSRPGRGTRFTLSLPRA